LQKFARCSDNRNVVKNSSSVQKADLPVVESAPFSPGALVIVTLGNPRDKFWGMILTLAQQGLSISGIELASFDDLAVMVKDGEPYTPAVVFFPMHRIERIDLDQPDGGLPSLSQRFQAKTGRLPSAVLRPRAAGATGDAEFEGLSASRSHSERGPA
jgi:hypothetical protein